MNPLFSGLTGLVLLASTAAGQLDGTRLRTLTSDGTWSVRRLGLGDHGASVFSVTGGLEPQAVFLPADPMRPSWQGSLGAQTGATQVGSARHADRHISLVEEMVPGSQLLCRAVLRGHGPASPAALWELPLPFTDATGSPRGCAISDDGLLAAVWSKSPTSGRTWLATLDAVTGQTRFIGDLSLSGVATSGALTGDGSSLFLSAAPRLMEVDTRTGSASSIGWILSPDSRGLHVSADGDRLVLGEASSVRVLERQSSGDFSPAPWGPIPWEDVPDALALSRDGRIAVLATSSLSPGRPITIRCVELDGGSELMRHSMDSAQDLPGRVMSVTISDDGERVAAALSGDSTQEGPEVLLFTCWQDEPIWSLDQPSSAWDVALSPDGRRLAVALLDGSLFGNGAGKGRYSIYEIEPTPLILSGDPSAGSTVRLVQRLEGSTQGCLLVAPQLAGTPTPFGPLGMLQLDRQQTTVIHGGTLTPEGSLSTPVHLGGVQAGLTLHFQGLQLAPRRLTANRVSVTVTP